MEKIHLFEQAGLGIAPFRCVGFASLPNRELAEKNPTAYNNALRDMPSGYHYGTCQYCSTALTNHCLIKSSDGKQFVVGSECVRKTGDRGMVDFAARAKREAVQARKQAERQMLWEAGREEREAKEAEAKAQRTAKWLALEEANGPLLTLLGNATDWPDGFMRNVVEEISGEYGRLILPRPVTTLSPRCLDIMADIYAKRIARKGTPRHVEALVEFRAAVLHCANK